LFIAHGGVELVNQMSQVWFIREPSRKMYDLTKNPWFAILAEDRSNFMSTKVMRLAYESELSTGDFVRLLMFGRRIMNLVKEMMEVKMLDNQHVEGTEIAKKVINEELKKLVGAPLFHLVKPLEEFWLDHIKDLASNVGAVNANLADIEVGIFAIKSIMDVYAKNEGAHLDSKPMSTLPTPTPAQNPTQIPRQIEPPENFQPFRDEDDVLTLSKRPSMVPSKRVDDFRKPEGMEMVIPTRGFADIDGGRSRRRRRRRGSLKGRKTTRRRTRRRTTTKRKTKRVSRRR
jgi:hypothetical protein